MLYGQVLESVSNAKYPGLDLSTDLIFTIHISRITSSVNRSIVKGKTRRKWKNSIQVIGPARGWICINWSPILTNLKWFSDCIRLEKKDFFPISSAQCAGKNWASDSLNIADWTVVSSCFIRFTIIWLQFISHHVSKPKIRNHTYAHLIPTSNTGFLRLP
jgi:hypothetical protein